MRRSRCTGTTSRRRMQGGVVASWIRRGPPPQAVATHCELGQELQGLLARWDELRRREVSAVNQRRNHRGWLGNVSGATWLVSRRFSDRARQYAGCNDRLPALVRQSGDSSEYPLRAILEIGGREENSRRFSSSNCRSVSDRRVKKTRVGRGKGIGTDVATSRDLVPSA